MRIAGIFQMRDARLRTDERAARVDRVHQIVALHRRVYGLGQMNGAGVVDEDVYAAKRLDGFGNSGGYDVFIADVYDQR